MPLCCDQRLSFPDSDFVSKNFLYKIKRKDHVHILAIDLTSAVDTVLLDSTYVAKALLTLSPATIFQPGCRHLFLDIKINKEHYFKEITVY